MSSHLGLICGIEIHQQLDGKKLFCSCPTQLRDDQPHFRLQRQLRATAGESGEIDIAARSEQRRSKIFVYEGYHDTTCLVETDSEPPHDLNPAALYTSLQFSQLAHASITPIIQVMRKTVVDGSNTSGFQRTALVARHGFIDTSEGKVRIDNISLEEDSCKIIAESATEKIYRLDRLGIPLIEIGTGPDIHSPEQCLETAQKLGLFLRSLPGVKRGLGTIRQDVNVSIKGGTRVEIKGAQELKQLPLLVELEMKRQEELLKIRDFLKGKKLNSFQNYDLTSLLKNSQAKIIQTALAQKGEIWGLKCDGFTGLLGRELQPNYRVGTEFSGRVKIASGLKGIFHSDELPNYGITADEVTKIKQFLNCQKDDAFVFVAGSPDRCHLALRAIYQRAQELWHGVPPEVRKAEADGTTSYLRPMPGASRMYPETDVPLIRPNVKTIILPELLEAKILRFQKDLGLSKDLATFVAKSDKVLLFEELTEAYPAIKPAFIADILTSMLLEIKRQYDVDPSLLTDDHFRTTCRFLAEDKIHKDIVLNVLIDMIKGTFDINRYAQMGTEEIHRVINDIVAHNKDAPFPALMGLCMKQLAGKASGKFIAEQLQRILAQGHR